MSSFVETFRPYGLRAESMVTAYGLAESTLAVTSSWGHVFPAVVDLRRDDLEDDRVVVASPG